MSGAVNEIENLNAAGALFQGIIADGDTASCRVAIRLFAVNVVGRALIGAQKINLRAALRIDFHRLPQALGQSSCHVYAEKDTAQQESNIKHICLLLFLYHFVRDVPKSLSNFQRNNSYYQQC